MSPIRNEVSVKHEIEGHGKRGAKRGHELEIESKTIRKQGDFSPG